MGIYAAAVDGMAIAVNGRVLVSGVDEQPAENPSKLSLEYSIIGRAFRSDRIEMLQ